MYLRGYIHVQKPVTAKKNTPVTKKTVSAGKGLVATDQPQTTCTAVSVASTATPTKVEQPKAKPVESQTPPVAGGGAGTVQEAVRQLKRAGADMGVKKLVAQVREAYPELEAGGLTVGSKQVRQAVEALSTVGLDTPDRK